MKQTKKKLHAEKIVGWLFLEVATWKEPEKGSEKLECTSVSNKITYLLKHWNCKCKTDFFGSPLKLRNPTILFLCAF